MIKFLFVSIITLVILGCQKRDKEMMLSKELKEAIENGQDTTLIDDAGRKIQLQVNSKIVSIGNSINGNVKYLYSLMDGEPVFDKYGNVSKMVYKDALKNDTLKIYISDDSLSIGEDLRAYVWVKHEKFKVNISEPLSQIVSSDTFDNDYELHYTCTQEGVHSFKGEVSFDSRPSIPFEYKFVVVGN